MIVGECGVFSPGETAFTRFITLSKGVFVSLDESESQPQESLLLRLRKALGLQPGLKEIQQVLDESEEQGLIDEEQGDMIEGIFDLKQSVAREIMIPRTRIVALSLSADKNEILDTLIRSGHSRFPVYRENVDRIVGILTAKDLLPFWRDGEDHIRLEAVLRPPLIVPETITLNELLNEMRTKKNHMALVVDDYGGTSGIVTLEDIVEEIIGEIHDEHDIEEELFVEQPDGSFIVNARVSLSEFEERLDVSLPRAGYDTLGGFLIHLMGKVPKIGEEVRHDGLSMRIQAGDAKRITRILVAPVDDREDEVTEGQSRASL